MFFLKMLWFFLTLPVLLQRCRCSTYHLVVQAWNPVYTPRVNRERPESEISFKIFEKRNILWTPCRKLIDIFVVMAKSMQDCCVSIKVSVSHSVQSVKQRYRMSSKGVFSWNSFLWNSLYVKGPACSKNESIIFSSRLKANATNILVSCDAPL